jgi:predicted peroxiredoxin
MEVTMKIKLFPTVTLTAALSLFVASASIAAQQGPPGLDCPQGQNIVVHLKRHINDLQGAQVAVRLATVLEQQVIDMPGSSPDDHVNVTLFLTLQGPRLVDPAQPQDLVFGSASETLEQVVEGFLSAGGTIYACPLCATEIGLDGSSELLYTDDYPDNVKVAGGPEIVKTFLCADKVLDF